VKTLISTIAQILITCWLGIDAKIVFVILPLVERKMLIVRMFGIKFFIALILKMFVH